jgi:diaminopimelate epimerase
MKIKIYIMSGAGNIFTVFDNSVSNIPNNTLKDLSQILCNNSYFFPKRTDGLIVLNNNNSICDFDAMFYNPDGSTGVMCGNGGRCAVYLACHLDLINNIQNKEFIFFKMSGVIYKSKFNDDLIQLYFPPAKEIIENVEINIYDNILKASYVDVNTRHIIFDYEDIKNVLDGDFENFNINNFAVPIRYHAMFEPLGVNVNIFSKIEDNIFALRTYERGVEAETGACGTGAISTALIINRKYNIDFPIKIIPTSKIPLYIKIDNEHYNSNSNIILEGNAEIIEVFDFEM